MTTVWQGAKTTRKVSSKAKANAPSNAPEEILGAEEDANTRLAEDLSKIRVVESREVSLRETLDEKERTEQTRSLTSRECGVSDMILSVSSEESIPQPNGIQHISRIAFVWIIYLYCLTEPSNDNIWMPSMCRISRPGPFKYYYIILIMGIIASAELKKHSCLNIFCYDILSCVENFNNSLLKILSM